MATRFPNSCSYSAMVNSPAPCRKMGRRSSAILSKVSPPVQARRSRNPARTPRHIGGAAHGFIAAIVIDLLDLQRPERHVVRGLVAAGRLFALADAAEEHGAAGNERPLGERAFVVIGFEMHDGHRRRGGNIMRVDDLQQVLREFRVLGVELELDPGRQGYKSWRPGFNSNSTPSTRNYAAPVRDRTAVILLRRRRWPSCISNPITMKARARQGVARSRGTMLLSRIGKGEQTPCVPDRAPCRRLRRWSSSRWIS